MTEPGKDPSKRVMYVTMGTSLFHSATWEPTAEVCQRVPGYEEWTKDDCRNSPSNRLGHALSSSIQNSLRQALRAEKTDEWVRALPQSLIEGNPSPASFFRYSAELTTILKLSEENAMGGTLSDFLNGYAQIRLVCDQVSNGPNLPFVAATHLKSYLNVLAPLRTELVVIPGLSSHDPEKLLREEASGLPRLISEVRNAVHESEQIDIVASGGYKIYGVILSQLLGLMGVSVGIHYLHEEGQLLLSARGPKVSGPRSGGHNDLIFNSARELVRHFVP